MNKRKFISLAVVFTFIFTTINPSVNTVVKATDNTPTIIYNNDFENASNLPSGKTASDLSKNVNDSTALRYDVKFDPNSTWDEKAEMDLNYEYSKPINSGAKLQIDLILPANSAYTGSIKVVGVTKMGSGWTWTQSNTIPEVKASDFTQSNGYLVKTAEIPFGDEITTNTGLHQIIFKLAGYKCNYNGKVYIDNVKLIDGAESSQDNKYVDKTVQPIKQTKVNPSLLNIPSEVNLVDGNAINQTASLYAYLKGIGTSNYVIYGHQNDTHHKAFLTNSGTNSDTKDITGSIAGVCGIDGLSLTGSELSLPQGQTDLVTAAANVSINAAKEGSIVSLSAHMPNFDLVAKKGLVNGNYDYSGYTPDTTSGNVVQRIMPGGDLNKVYTGYLDLIANYGSKLQDQGIPVLFRPFHENNGSWFWWGAAYCDSAAYKNLYKYTVDYLRDVKNIHNFLYVYSPGGPFESEDAYLDRYPGDNYVDILGFDMYDDNPAAGDNTWLNSFKNTMNVVDNIAKAHNKLSAVTEVGIRDTPSMNGMKVSGNSTPDWFNDILNAVSGTNMSYFMTWANFSEQNFYEPYMVSSTKGQEMVNNFINFYNKEDSVFADGIGDYSKISVTSAKPSTTGFITSPASGSRILNPTTLTANIKNSDSSNVSFVIKDGDGNLKGTIQAQKSDNNTYTGELTQDILKNIAPTYGSIELNIDGKQYDKINALINIPEQATDPAQVDNFESYYGNDALLQTNWTSNVGPGCSISPSLTKDPLQHNSGSYGLTFNYNITGTSSSEGWAGITKKENVDWSNYDALQLWIKPDGKGQKLVVQITSNGEDFEVYLPEFAATTEPKLLTLPFSKFVGKNNGKFDPSKITKVGLWCNTIVPQGSKDITVNSTMYFDDIKAVNTKAPSNGQGSQTGNSTSTNTSGSQNGNTAANQASTTKNSSTQASKVATLPQTGSAIDGFVLVILGTILTLIGAAFVVFSKRKAFIKK